MSAKKSADETLKYLLLLFFFSPENRLWQFVRIVALEDNCHVMSKPIFVDSKIQYHLFVAAECAHD